MNFIDQEQVFHVEKYWRNIRFFEEVSFYDYFSRLVPKWTEIKQVKDWQS